MHIFPAKHSKISEECELSWRKKTKQIKNKAHMESEDLVKTTKVGRSWGQLQLALPGQAAIFGFSLLWESGNVSLQLYAVWTPSLPFCSSEGENGFSVSIQGCTWFSKMHKMKILAKIVNINNWQKTLMNKHGGNSCPLFIPKCIFQKGTF